MSTIADSADLSVKESSKYSKKTIRLAVSLFYFGQGLVFASWASRIPDLKAALNLSDAALGSILLALPIGQLITMPLSGRLVAIFGSKKILTMATPLYALCLTNLALAAHGWQLALFLLLFGISGNLCNIALNTQAVTAEGHYGKPIMSSFHGSWSLGLFTGALVGLLMMNLHLTTTGHFWIIAAIGWTHIFINHRFLLVGKTAQKEKPKFLTRPQGVLVQLGVIAFCSMATEGAMMDWSGVYFKEIVHAPVKWIILGYASYSAMMTIGRFVGDKFIASFGRKTMLQICGVVISAGMFLSVAFPQLMVATFGFMMVGIGVSVIIPMTYTIAGNNDKIPSSLAIAMVSSIGYFGFLMGPPLIGYISELFSLRYSFAVVGCFGILISLLVRKISAIR
ncbi:MFS transporter [Pedobacter nanyangensis]|uniref:MFS transporter n=1 Tax=Pedobacter nanyangensis TaxID=1562389 RepID=UPI000DE1BCFD|nr:MFS transporter [Pedobacter nanyangensis]